MGGQKLANKVAMKAVSSVCWEANGRQVQRAYEALRIQTTRRMFSVRWANWSTSPNTWSIPSPLRRRVSNCLFDSGSAGLGEH